MSDDPGMASSVSLPVFGFVTVHERPLADGMAQEARWCEQVAATGRAVAHLWQGVPGFVVPRRYERLPRWREACAAAVARGRSVQVRASGGGLVPQGPGVWNLSLVWRAPQAAPVDTTSLYAAFAGELAAALERLGLRASTQAVQGSFCDGRFNLAIDGRKCIGTAQAWRRIAGQPVVLLHAVIVASAEPNRLTDEANAFEADAGSESRYRSEALVSVAQACRAAMSASAPVSEAPCEARLLTALAEQFARVVPPHVHGDEAASASALRSE